MDKQTFQQYLASKDQLLKAIENTPTAVYEYQVKKYCSVAVGETEDEQQLIGLKPSNKLIVEWRYDDIDNPTPESIKVIGAKDVDESEQLSTPWPGSKLAKWLARHAIKG